MAELRKRFEFEFTEDEMRVLLKLTGEQSPKAIGDRGLNVEAFEAVHAALAEAMYAPVSEERV